MTVLDDVQVFTSTTEGSLILEDTRFCNRFMEFSPNLSIFALESDASRVIQTLIQFRGWAGRYPRSMFTNLEAKAGYL